MMKKLLTAFVMFLALCSTAQTVNITFELNMASIETSETGVFIAGGGNFGNPGDNPMTETSPGSDIYTITFTQPAGFSSYYTFTNGNCPDYSCKENLVGLPCGDPANFNDRFLPPVNEDVTISTCFGQCSTDGTCEVIETTDITFSVDMNDYLGNFSTISVGGTWNGFNPVEFPMTETSPGSGIYETTLGFPEGSSQEYKFIEDGGIDGEEYYETLQEGDPCTVSAFGFTNRLLVVGSEDEVLPTVCFEACEACEDVLPDYEVIFKVDMSEYTGPAFTTVDLNGSFNGFCGFCAPMSDDDGDDVYELAVTIEQGTVEYLYFLDGATTGQESFNDGDPCTSTIDGFVNRTLDVTSDIELDVVCYNECEACGVSSLTELDQDAFSLFPNPSDGMIQIKSGSSDLNDIDEVSVYSLSGKRLMNFRLNNNNTDMLDLRDLESGIYMVELSSDKHFSIETIVIK